MCALCPAQVDPDFGFVNNDFGTTSFDAINLISLAFLLRQRALSNGHYDVECC
jgi:hypothetical protein